MITFIITNRKVWEQNFFFFFFCNLSDFHGFTFHIQNRRHPFMLPGSDTLRRVLVVGRAGC